MPAARPAFALLLSVSLATPGAAQEQPIPANRLAKEKSPYLQQHAHNPVDWYPWGEEAFAKAKRENKPIFLSVGYSTCHWCHVMERESFADAEIAKLINEWFVPVKVDREERPDVDRIYMTFVQAATGSGGWPMTVFLTPDRKPFFGGTYFPPEDRQGMPGIKQVLSKVHEAWDAQREDVEKSAESLTQAVGQIVQVKPPEGGDGGAIDAALLAKSYQRLASTYDKEYAGFGRAPKFPEPVNLNFLVHEAARTGEAAPRDMALQTLRRIAAGGINDHLGGGFHRYSTDRRWFLPHFEKMLYDQGQLASCFLDAFQIKRDPLFADQARGVLDYVLRDLTGPQGQFYSAEDADSAHDPAKPHDKEEGAFYVWTAAEIGSILGPDDAPVFNHHFGITPEGNVPAAQDPRKEFTGKNVLFAAHTVAETAARFKKPEPAVREVLGSAKQKLFAARVKRPRPHRDDKTIVAWNALAISAFARAGVILDEPRYTAAATRAADFIHANLYDPNSKSLTRIWRDGPASVPGFLDDHAFLVQSLLDLYECTLDIRWLRWAIELQSKQDELFEDKEAGGYFTTSGLDPTLLHRVKDDQEGVEPAGNSVAALNLLRLSQMTDDSERAEQAGRIFKTYSGRLHEYPSAFAQMLVAIDFSLSKPTQIVLAGDPTAADTRALLREAHAGYLPNRVILGADGGEGQAFLAARAPFLRGMKAQGGKATAYVCQNYTCQQPTNDIAVFRKQLGR